MISASTLLSVVDNTGVLLARCFKVLGGHKKQIANSGEPVIVAIKKTRPRRRFKKGEVAKVIILSTKVALRRKSGFIVKSNKNTAIMVNDNLSPIANRVSGAVPHEVRREHNRGFLLVKRNY